MNENKKDEQIRQETEKAEIRKGCITIWIFIFILAITFLLGMFVEKLLINAHHIETVRASPIINTAYIPVISKSKTDNADNIILRDDITCGNNTLSYELQKKMQQACNQYGVPYALALAVAEAESSFDAYATSNTNDYGLMQINEINYKYFKDIGLDVLKPVDNVEAGILMLSEALDRYGEIELALMAYNCGDTGAKKLWDVGTYKTAYSRAVMSLYEKWLGVLEVQ